MMGIKEDFVERLSSRGKMAIVSSASFEAELRALRKFSETCNTSREASIRNVFMRHCGETLTPKLIDSMLSEAVAVSHRQIAFGENCGEMCECGHIKGEHIIHDEVAGYPRAQNNHCTFHGCRCTNFIPSE